MRRIRYSVAMSLDGYIAGPNGEADWIIMDPDVDFTALVNQFDTVLLGRKTFEDAQKRGRGWPIPGLQAFVFSRTLRQKDHPGVTIVSEKQKEMLTALKKKPGKDIWLMGGGSLFTSLLDVEMVDTVEVAVVPVMLGTGIPLVSPPAKQARLMLINHKVLEKTGSVMLEYDIKELLPSLRAHLSKARPRWSTVEG